MADVADIEQHIRGAQCASHPLQHLGTGLFGDTREACAWVVGSPDPVAQRADMFQALAQASRLLEPCSACLWRMRLAPHAEDMAGERLHVALFDLIADVIGWPDERLAEDALCGAPVGGRVPDSGV